MRLNDFEKREEKEEAKIHPDAENNKILAKWVYETWNEKAKSVCRNEKSYRDDDKEESGECRNTCICVWKDRIEIAYDKKIGKLWYLYALPISYNIFTNDFKRKCNIALTEAGVLRR